MAKSKIRLLIVADYFYPHWTGIAKSMYYFLEGVHKYYDVTLLTVKHDRGLKAKEKIFSANVIRENYLFTISRSKYSIALVFKFLSIVKNFDVVVVNSPSANILIVSLIAKIFNKKILIVHHGDLILPKRLLNGFIEKIFDVSTYLSLMIASKATSFTLDYANKSRILKRFIDKSHELIFPISFGENTLKCENIPLLEKLKKEKKIILGFAGRFVEEKGFDILLKAIPIVKKSIPDVVFIFAGETNIFYENFYQKNKKRIKEAGENLIILGLLEKSKLACFYNALDFIVLPSRSDCFPLVQVEAMLCSVPAIVTDIPGLRYLVKKTGFGLISRKEDPVDLADKIIYGVRNREKIMLKYEKTKSILNNETNVEKIRRFIEE